MEPTIQNGACPACEEARKQGVPNVFCPACALGRALSLGGMVAQARGPHGNAPKMELTKKSPEVGDVIEDYEILEKIGGNMGFVFKARHQLLNKVVALKLFPAEWITDLARLGRFEREMRAMGQLNHPNLVTAADARNVRQWKLVVMEWIDGPDLQLLVRTRGPLPYRAACEAVRQAAVALQYAHNHGLIHRDVKPSNLMITRSGDIKVIDMGLAVTCEDSTQITQPGFAVGTMTYCAPEQFRDASCVDSRADIYSLGCTLFQLLAGKPAFGEKKTFAELLNAHLHEPLPSIRKVRPDIPDELERIVARMTAKDPAARFQTAAEVAAALEPYGEGANLGQLLVPTSHPEPVRRIQDIPSYPNRGGAPRKSLWPAGLVAILLALGAVGGVYLYLNRDPVVVLMDTTAPGGVYDEDNRVLHRGVSNAEELTKVLHQLLPHSLRPYPISSTWEGEAQVVAQRPSLVVLHRSMFFHSLNAELQFGKPPFGTNTIAEQRWKTLYQIADERVKMLLAYINASTPSTKFLVYSRGTDENWLKDDYRESWIRDMEQRFPSLKGRIRTLVIPNPNNMGSFRDEKTARMMRKNVAEMLGLAMPTE